MKPIREGLFEIAPDGSGYLLINRCERCGRNFFPRRIRCISCLKDDCLKDTTLSKIGKLHTYTTVYRASPSFNVPFNVGYVDFEEEGIRIFAQLVGCKSEELKIGMNMELTFEPMDLVEKDKQIMVYKFRPI